MVHPGDRTTPDPRRGGPSARTPAARPGRSRAVRGTRQPRPNKLVQTRTPRTEAQQLLSHTLAAMASFSKKRVLTLLAVTILAASLTMFPSGADAPAWAREITATCGNTTTDDETLNRVIAGSAPGDEIVIDGPCLINDTIKLLGERSYRGRSRAGTVIRQADGANLPVMLASDSYLDNDSHTGMPVSIRSISLDGRRTANPRAGDGLVMRSWQSVVEDVEIIGAARHAIRLTNLSANGTPWPTHRSTAVSSETTSVTPVGGRSSSRTPATRSPIGSYSTTGSRIRAPTRSRWRTPPDGSSNAITSTERDVPRSPPRGSSVAPSRTTTSKISSPSASRARYRGSLLHDQRESDIPVQRRRGDVPLTPHKLRHRQHRRGGQRHSRERHRSRDRLRERIRNGAVRRFHREPGHRRHHSPSDGERRHPQRRGLGGTPPTTPSPEHQRRSLHGGGSRSIRNC